MESVIKLSTITEMAKQIAELKKALEEKALNASLQEHLIGILEQLAEERKERIEQLVEDLEEVTVQLTGGEVDEEDKH